ncbi:MAG: response regulator [Deltaproteobacteria bacterium]|nr:response regulator [Deltaproteobacteria bacterium]
MTAAGPTLLLVDDEADVVASLRRTLAPLHHRILTTTDPTQVLTIIASDSVDLLISDIDMGEVSGLDVVENVRAWFPDVVRILLTGRARVEVALKAINSGEVFRFLTKPWEPEELRQIVELGLARRAELREQSTAARTVERRRQLVADLEAEFPGISNVRRVGGLYVVDETASEAMLQAWAGSAHKI